jgi:hypothetical protein
MLRSPTAGLEVILNILPIQGTAVMAFHRLKRSGIFTNGSNRSFDKFLSHSFFLSRLALKIGAFDLPTDVCVERLQFSRISLFASHLGRRRTRDVW